MNVLLIFARNPEKGKVKTRIASEAGEDKALEIYRELLSYTRDVTVKCDVVLRVCFSEYIEENGIWAGNEFERTTQQGTDLGDRMANAFEDAFAQGAKNVAVIGTDCIELRARHIEQAFISLEKYDCVTGPAEDGGYWLLAMRQFTPELFRNKKWSTDTLLRDTLADLRSLGKSYYLLDTLSDIDTIDDWKRAKKK